MLHAGKNPKSMYAPGRRAFSPREDSQVAMPWAKVGAWYVGPKAENEEIYKEMVLKAMDAHLDFRKNYFPSDPAYVTPEIKDSDAYKKEIENMRTELATMREEMKKSVPYFTPRYKGHVVWDPSMPAQLGYLTAFMYHQNNAIEEAGNITTTYEVEAGKDLCRMVGFDYRGRGHLTAGGTVANCEAMWCARNVKFLPFAMQDAVNEEDDLQGAKDMSIDLPGGGTKKLVEATTWDLLNLNTDVIVEMPDKIADTINQGKSSTSDQMTYMEVMKLSKKYKIEAKGVLKFCEDHGIKGDTFPVCIMPTTAHISLFKGTNLSGMGLGEDRTILIPCDENSRMKTDDLEDKLESLRTAGIAVVAVCAVMGTTEESAIDNVDEILKIRHRMRKKNPPLDFLVHCDAAWGGYFCTMIRKPPGQIQGQATADEGFVPELPLSSFVQTQLNRMKHADTITLDPHKSGFCTYPAGAIAYRKARINDVVSSMVEADTPYYYGSVNLGNWGIEGSKPGNSAAAVYLANKVIGLHKFGHGRILAECTFTSKLMYCLWTTLARDEDPFVVVTTKPLKGEKIPQNPVQFIRDNIMGKSNEEIEENAKAMEFLQEVGPDTLMPNFAVNFKKSGHLNDSVDKCNLLNDAVFKLNVHATDQISARRWPMLVTASYFAHHSGSGALKALKERLGLSTVREELQSLRYIICCAMDPFATSMDFIEDFGNIMRNAILCSIGTVNDKQDHHNFVTSGQADEDNNVVLYYAGGKKSKSHQYSIFAKFRVKYGADVREIRNKAGGTEGPLVFRTTGRKLTLHDLLLKNFEEGKDGLNFKVDCYNGLLTESWQLIKKGVEVQVVDVARYRRFDLTDIRKYDGSQFFLYGDRSNRAFLANMPVKGNNLDFYQFVELASVPEHIDEVLLLNGVEMSLFHIDPQSEGILEPGEPVVGLVEQGSEYIADFIGHDGVEYKTTVRIWKDFWHTDPGLFK
ncbi:L-tyrosine decarboxylase-like [Acropora muricata]|uniref:L-tyrosine decarboxylase-like n=1 Tax=Acropora muricata TaxID=159855 RepID=UPI0034E4FDF4